jgi:starch phosphorylase
MRVDMTAGLPQVGTIAYFSMDVAVDSNIPTYSGGLGVLAGDMLCPRLTYRS